MAARGVGVCLALASSACDAGNSGGSANGQKRRAKNFIQKVNGIHL
jgi:hypothetical protein